MWAVARGGGPVHIAFRPVPGGRLSRDKLGHYGTYGRSAAAMGPQL